MTDCPFCAIARGEAPAHVVHKTATAIAFFATGPAAPYHTLVVPRRHARDLFDIAPEDWLGVTSAVKDVVDLYRQRLGLENVELTQHSGAAAQQGVFHLHVHIVPRHEGDGQDTHWTERPDIEDRFDELLRALKSA